MAKPYMAQWRRLPPELLPFVQSLKLSTLAEILKAHPSLYWHPLVFIQITYLGRLRHDEAEWQRLGWEPQWDHEYGTEWPPKEVGGVSRQLAQLVEAHVSGMFPGRRIIWKAEPKQRGRKSGFSNPHPTGSWDEWVEAERLERDFRQLHALLKARLTAAGRSKDKQWYQRLAQEVLEESSISWSDLHMYTQVAGSADRQAVVGDPPPGASEAELWEYLQRLPVPQVEARWAPLDLGNALERLLVPSKRGRALRDGLPAYLAYAVLGALLAVTPEQIKNALDNFRHPRRRERTE
jgi:hypothetical protein